MVFWNIWGHHNFLLRLPDLYKVNVVFNLLNGPLSNEVATLVAICLLPPPPAALCSWKHVWSKPCVPKYVRQTFELALLVSCTKCYSTYILLITWKADNVVTNLLFYFLTQQTVAQCRQWSTFSGMSKYIFIEVKRLCWLTSFN